MPSGGLTDNYAPGPEPVMRTMPASRNTLELVEDPTGPDKVNVWSIGKRQVAAMVAGVILFAALFFLYNSFGFIYVASIASIALAWSILLFVGTAFGPWAGLVTGGGGFLLGWVFAQGLFNFDSFFWRQELGYATAGFIAGLALYMTQGRYHHFQSIAGAFGIAIIAAFIGTYISFFPSIISQNIVSFIPGLALLPILLALYNAIVSKSGEARDALS